MKRRALDSNHKRLTAAALTTGALMVVTLIGPFSDRTFFCFLVAFVGFSLLAITAATHKVDEIFDDELGDPDPLNQNLIPKHHQPSKPTSYDLTVGWLYPGDPQATADSQRIYRHLTAGDLWHRLIEAGVPTHIAAEANGRTTLPGGMQLTWTRTTDTTGETR